MNKEILQKTFGKILKQLRLQAKLSQEKLSFESQCNRSYISDLERGKYSPSLYAIFQLSASLNLQPEELIGKVRHALKSESKKD